MAFEANSGLLWTVGSGGNVSWRLGMWPGTGPAIAGLAGGGYEVAFEANSGLLWTVGSAWECELAVRDVAGDGSGDRRAGRRGV